MRQVVKKKLVAKKPAKTTARSKAPARSKTSAQKAAARQERKNERRRQHREEMRKAAKRKAPAAQRVAESPVGLEPVLPEVSGITLSQFDENVANYVRSQLGAALLTVCETNGLRAEVGKPEVDAEYGDAMKVTLVFRVPKFDARGSEVPYRETAWLRYAHTLGLRAEWLGRKVIVGRVLYRIAGLDLKNKVKPILLSHDGKLYAESVANVVKAIRG